MVRVALRQAIQHNWLDEAINLCSGNKGFCHAELVFSDGLSYSSTSREGEATDSKGRPKKNGTRFKYIDYDNDPKWVIFKIECPDSLEAKMRDFANQELDCRYDFKGCLRFALPFVPQDKKEWFCSEIVVACLQRGLIWVDAKPWKMAPNDVYERCIYEHRRYA